MFCQTSILAIFGHNQPFHHIVILVIYRIFMENGNFDHSGKKKSHNGAPLVE
jgi:hypothetical protein